MLTFSHPGSRIQGSKKYPIPDPGSATLDFLKIDPDLVQSTESGAVIVRRSYFFKIIHVMINTEFFNTFYCSRY
jgi:hypothetical protein